MTTEIIDGDKKLYVLYDALTSEKLELTLFPTEHCNFRCTYCYEDFLMGRMKPEIVTGIKNLITSRAPELRRLFISWFGGEPLLAYDIMKEVSRHAKAICDENSIGLRMNVTTNGYNLSETRLIELHNYGVTNYQISLDGDDEEHNKTRLRADGQGTFDKIWQNLILYNTLCGRGDLSGTNIMLRLHAHPKNISSLKNLANRIKNELNPDYFTVYVKDVGKYGGKNDNSYDVIGNGKEYKDVKDSIYSIVDRFANISEEKFISSCYAAKANAFTIRSDGSIGKCTVALKSARNSIGKLREDGSFELDSEKSALWMYPLATMSRADLSCPLINLPELTPRSFI